MFYTPLTSYLNFQYCMPNSRFCVPTEKPIWNGDFVFCTSHTMNIFVRLHFLWFIICCFTCNKFVLMLFGKDGIRNTMHGKSVSLTFLLLSHFSIYSNSACCGYIAFFEWAFIWLAYFTCKIIIVFLAYTSISRFSMLTQRTVTH